MNIRIILFILVIAGLTLPFLAMAGSLSGPIVPCGIKSDPTRSHDCTLCDIFVMIQNIVDFLLAFILIIAPVFVLVGGIFILTAAGRPDQVGQGKRVITYAITGVVIALLSWTFLNMLFNALVSESAGFPWPWNEIDCVGGGVGEGNGGEKKICTCGRNTTLGSHRYASESECLSQCSSYCNGRFPGEPGCCGTDVFFYGCEGATPTGEWRFQSGVQYQDEQRADASSALKNFLDCFYDKAPADIGYISAITDKDIYNGTCDPQDCKVSNSACPTNNCRRGYPCDHSCPSCHYGGTCPSTDSYAVDFGDEGNVCEIADYALQCGNVNKIYGPQTCGGKVTDDNQHEDHVHVSVNNSCSCN